MERREESTATRVTDWDWVQKIAALPTYHLIHWDKERAYRRILRDARLLGSSHSLIDLGCGPGHSAAALWTFLPLRRITLVDQSVPMLALARRTMANGQSTAPADDVPEIQYILGDLFSLNTTERFDIVLSQGVVEHFDPPRRRELLSIHRTLCAPEGYVLIAVPTPTPVYRAIRSARELSGTWWFPDEQPLTIEDLDRETRAVGLTIERATTFWDFYLTELLVLCRCL